MMQKKKRTTNKTAKDITKFILASSLVIGLSDDKKLIRTKEGFIGVIKIEGIDIYSFTESDQRIAMHQFARAEHNCKIPHKLIFVDIKPNLTEQKSHISHRKPAINSERLNYIYDRMISTLLKLEVNQTERVAYAMFFSKVPDRIYDGMNVYKNNLSDCQITDCHGETLETFMRSVLQFTTESSDS